MQAPARPAVAAPSSPRRRSSRVLRAVGWVLITAGITVLLYVVYALYYTGLETERAQSALLEEWEAELGPIEIPDAPDALVPEIREPDAGPPDVGGALAVLGFNRPGRHRSPVTDDYLVVVEGVDNVELQAGPGHYPTTALPGEEGNFAIAGHRVTYAAPFHRLDDLEEGDEIHVWDRSGNHHVYRVAGTEIVRPTDAWVLEDDPLGTGEPTITLTTCHPRYSNRERLIAFGELVS